MVVALTFERHFAICSPHAYRIRLRTTERWKHLFWYIAPVILLAIICNIPLMINLLKVTNQESHTHEQSRRRFTFYWFHFQTDLIKNALYVRVNLYLRGLHPLATTGLIPFLLLVILNIKVVRGIRVLTRKQIRRYPTETTAGSVTTEELVKTNYQASKYHSYYSKKAVFRFHWKFTIFQFLPKIRDTLKKLGPLI